MENVALVESVEECLQTLSPVSSFSSAYPGRLTWGYRQALWMSPAEQHLSVAHLFEVRWLEPL